MKIGRKAIFGIGNPAETSGSKNQRITGTRAMPTPSATPATAAATKPMAVRMRVSVMPWTRSPETVS
jgi:hypothetical protein